MYNPLTSFLQNLNKQFMPLTEDVPKEQDITPTELDEKVFRDLVYNAEKVCRVFGVGAPYFGTVDIPHIVLETKISSKARKERN